MKSIKIYLGLPDAIWGIAVIDERDDNRNYTLVGVCMKHSDLIECWNKYYDTVEKESVK